MRILVAVLGKSHFGDHVFAQRTLQRLERNYPLVPAKAVTWCEPSAIFNLGPDSRSLLRQSEAALGSRRRVRENERVLLKPIGMPYSGGKP